MSQEATREYLAKARPRYQKADRQEKGRILTEFCLITGVCRTHAMRLMNGKAGLRTQRSGPKPKYGPELIGPLKALWLRMGQPCSKRLRVAIPVWLPHYRKRHPDLTEAQAKLLLEVSSSTIDRLLKPVRAKHGISATQAPSGQWYKSVIPVQAKDWNITEPGSLQGDTVAHCGDRLEGSFANTLTLTDIHTSWTETRACWTKGSSAIIEALKDIEKTLPFAIASIKFDSGSEFMNYGVISHLRSESTSIRPRRIEVLRSRPYKKDDNCYVEQKNLTHVRQLIGYDRIDVPECVAIMNRLYKQYWNPLQNFFLPAMKLVRKQRIGSRLKKTYDQPRTPYERALESPTLTDAAKVALREQYERLDPFELQEGVERELKLLFQALRKTKPLRLAG
jgi:hypothetical protein